MRHLLSPEPSSASGYKVASAPRLAPAMAPIVAVTGPAYTYSPNNYGDFNLRATILYVGVSIAVLVLGMVILTGFLVAYLRHNRTHRQRLLLQRHRQTVLQNVKSEEEVFKVQVRPVPVIIVQPDMFTVAFGKGEDEIESEGLDKLEDLYPQDCPESRPGGRFPRLDSTQSSASSSQASSSSQGESAELISERYGTPRSLISTSQSLRTVPSTTYSEAETPFFNPLTHYLTDRRPRLFEAEVSAYEPPDEIIDIHEGSSAAK